MIDRVGDHRRQGELRTAKVAERDGFARWTTLKGLCRTRMYVGNQSVEVAPDQPWLDQIEVPRHRFNHD